MTKEKQDIITNSYSNFNTTVNLLQSDVFNKIFGWLKANTGANSNLKTLSKLNKELKGLITAKMFQTPVKGLLKDFDQVEKISKKILESENGLDLKDFNLSAEKQLTIEEISTGLLNDAMLEANLRTPLKKMLYRYVTTGMPIDKAESELRSYILTDKESLGFAERYVKVLTMESLSRFDGTINQRVTTDYKLDGFRFVGSNIKTTEPQCRQMTTGTGDLARFEVNGKFRVEDLPEMIRIMKKYRSTHKNLDATNFFILRWHWGCRHQAIPTRLNENDKKAFAEKTNDDSVYKDSLEKYKNDPQRKELRKSIVEEFTSGDLSKKKIAYMTGGAPANGKSTYIDSEFSVIPKKNIVTIDSDEIKSRLPEYVEMIEKKNRRAASFVHEESSDIAKDIQKKAIDKGYEFLLDGVGDGDYDKFIKKTKEYKSNGHKLVANYVTLDTELSIKLAKDRYKKTGRYVPIKYIREMNSSVSRLVPKALDDGLFDEFTLWDTNKYNNPIKVLEYKNGNLLYIDKELYDNFLLKGGKANLKKHTIK